MSSPQAWQSTSRRQTSLLCSGCRTKRQRNLHVSKRGDEASNARRAHGRTTVVCVRGSLSQRLTQFQQLRPFHSQASILASDTLCERALDNLHLLAAMASIPSRPLRPKRFSNGLVVVNHTFLVASGKYQALSHNQATASWAAALVPASRTEDLQAIGSLVFSLQHKCRKTVVGCATQHTTSTSFHCLQRSHIAWLRPTASQAGLPACPTSA